MKKTIIAFTGPKGSGKSYMAAYLKSLGFEIKSFALPLKKALIEIFGHEHCFYDPKFKEEKHPATPQSARILMTSAGDFFRSLNKDCFTNKMVQDIRLSLYNAICIDDLRYNNEAEALRVVANELRCDLIVVCIDIPERVEANHSSENGIYHNYVTHTIFNDKTRSAGELLRGVLSLI